MNDPITEFKGEHRWLSNFWPACVYLDGDPYPSVEHAYVAAKTLDMDVRLSLARVASPGEVKRLGRKIVLRSDWDDVRLFTMEHLLRQKFHDRDLQAKLLATGDAILVEGNTWGDTFWGVCKGVGENHLGRLLMIIRGDLKLT